MLWKHKWKGSSMMCTRYIADLNLRKALLRSIMITGPSSHIQFL